MDYKGGLDRLKRQLRGTDKAQTFNILEARLRDNLEREVLHGTYDKGDRSQITEQLNLLAQEAINKSFNDLCQVSDYSNTGDALFKKRHFEEALEEYEKAIQILPDLLLLKKKSDVLLDLRRWNDVINICNTAIKLIEERPEEQHVAAQIYANKGMALFTVGKYKDALTTFDTAIAKDNSNTVLWQHRGEVCSVLENFGETKRSYDQAIYLASDEKKPYLHNEYGEALFKFQHFFEAIEEYRKAIHLKPDFAYAHKNLHTVCTVLARKAQEEYRRLQGR
jgi:tetratricopeptide (TPR) repeat protein